MSNPFVQTRSGHLGNISCRPVVRATIFVVGASCSGYNLYLVSRVRSSLLAEVAPNWPPMGSTQMYKGGKL